MVCSSEEQTIVYFCEFQDRVYCTHPDFIAHSVRNACSVKTEAKYGGIHLQLDDDPNSCTIPCDMTCRPLTVITVTVFTSFIACLDLHVSAWQQAIP